MSVGHTGSLEYVKGTYSKQFSFLVVTVRIYN